MKKVGIITFHCANNFGAMLQTYGLYRTLELNKYDVSIINYCPKSITDLYEPINIRIYKRYIKKPLTLAHLVVLRLKDYNNRKLKKENFERFASERLKLTPKIVDNSNNKYDFLDFDCMITGSDQVWNTDITLKFDPFYFLGFDNNCIKMSYAASLGPDVIKDSEKELFKKYIEDMDYISMREKTGIEVLKKTINKKIEHVLDPTLLLEKKEWESIVTDYKKEIPNEYILVYMLEKNSNLVNFVNKLSSEKNLKIISIADPSYFNNLYCNKVCNSIEEFIYLFKNAKYIITNSFHGTIFSIIFERKFLVIPHSKSGSRMIDVATALTLKDRIVYGNEENIIDRLDEEIDYKKVEETKSKLRDNSLKFLLNSIEGKKHD